MHADTPLGPKPRNTRAAGLILAGGAGRRFGGPKAFAHLPDKRTFLEACAGVMLRGGLEPLVATLPPDVTGDVPVTVQPLRLPQSGLDMFASITLGLQHLVKNLSWHRLILLPVDHPLIQTETITTLAAQDCPAAIPTLEGRHGHPIMISRTIAEGIAEGRLPGPTLREILRAAPARDVSVDDRGIRANCNTPESLLEAWSVVNG
ncbi:MAG: NTP transferase domain-containing protein [Acidobacteria bacterium]|nr:NTP transferase domain-containing protein [Acidobacteriota bacterium]